MFRPTPAGKPYLPPTAPSFHGPSRTGRPPTRTHREGIVTMTSLAASLALGSALDLFLCPTTSWSLLVVL